MIKRVSILSALLVLAAMGLATAAQAKPAIGLADQSVETLKDPRFQKSKLKRFRIAVSYDQVRKGGPLLARQDEFFRLAKQQRLDVLVSFYRTSSLSAKRAARSLPSVKGFRSDFRRFRKRYPHIKKFSTWNEMNFPLAQPTGRNPKRTGQFYLMLRKECRKKVRGGGKCSVLTGDFRANGSRVRQEVAEHVHEADRQGPPQLGPDRLPGCEQVPDQVHQAVPQGHQEGQRVRDRGRADQRVRPLLLRRTSSARTRR